MKKYIILGSVILFYIVSTLVINYISNINNVYLVFSDGNHLKYEKGKWDNANSRQIDTGQYKIINEGSFYINSKINESNELIKLKNDEILTKFMFAYKGQKVSDINYKILDLDNSDYKYLKKILLDKKINVDVEQISYTKKYFVDLNNDQNIETIYVISNNWDSTIGDLFSMIIIKENNKVIQYDFFEDEFSSYIPSLYFFDHKKDNNIELVIKNTYSSMLGQVIKIITFISNDEFNVIYESEVKK